MRTGGCGGGLPVSNHHGVPMVRRDGVGAEFEVSAKPVLDERWAVLQEQNSSAGLAGDAKDFASALDLVRIPAHGHRCEISGARYCDLGDAFGNFSFGANE